MKKIFTLIVMALAAISVSATVVKTQIIKTDFSNNQAIGGWGGTTAAADGVCTLTHTGTGNNWDAQACIDVNPTIPDGAKLTMTIKAKASANYSLKIGLQKSEGYAGRGDFEALPLTTDWQTFTKTASCNGEGANRVLLNFGDIDGTVYIDEIEIYYEEETGVDDYMLKVNTTAKSAPWDSQVLINIPQALTVGHQYEIKFSVKGTSAFESTPDNALGTIIENNSVGSDKRDSNNNSTELQYPATFSVTTDWNEVSVGLTNGNYAYDRLLINIGKYDGSLFFDNFRFIDQTDMSEITVDFKDGISGKADKRSWHSHVTIERAASDCPTAIKTVATKTLNDGIMYNLAGQRVNNAKGIVIINGKKVIK